MKDPTDNINTASATSRTYAPTENTNTDPTYSGDTTYGSYEDDSVPDSELRGANDIVPYHDTSAGGVRVYDPSDYSIDTIEAGQGARVYDDMTGAYDG